jgi:hypothetical protein
MLFNRRTNGKAVIFVRFHRNIHRNKFSFVETYLESFIGFGESIHKNRIISEQKSSTSSNRIKIVKMAKPEGLTFPSQQNRKKNNMITYPAAERPQHDVPKRLQVVSPTRGKSLVGPRAHELWSAHRLESIALKVLPLGIHKLLGSPL